jgi:CheY-like chemotaxis protein
MKLILYAEDEPDDVFFMERAFKSDSEARLVTVIHGGEVLAYLTGEGQFSDRAKYPLPHLILLDLKMPVMDGFDVLKWIRSTPAVSSIPVVVLTSSGNDKDKSRAAALGANGYLVKPGRPDKMHELITVFKEYWLKHDRLSDEKPR